MSRFRWFRRPTRARKALNAEDLAARIRQVEAVLFIAREPLTSRRISELADLEDGTQARTLIKQLNRRYDGAGSAFRVEQVAGGYQLLTRANFANWLRKLEHLPPELRLSQPAFETLSVVAYRQPVIRAEVESIRGVNCGEILRQLLERDLVRISGRGDELGRPFLYSTTKHFLKCFGLNNLDALPKSERARLVLNEGADDVNHDTEVDGSDGRLQHADRLPIHEESTVQFVHPNRLDDKLNESPE